MRRGTRVSCKKRTAAHAAAVSLSFEYNSFRRIGVEMLDTMISRITAVKYSGVNSPA